MSDQGKRYKKIKTRTFDNLKGFHQQQNLCTSTFTSKNYANVHLHFI